MKRKKKINLIIVLTVFFVLLIPCMGNAAQSIKLQNISHNKKIIYLGNDFTIKTNFKGTELKFKSSDTKVAKVNKNGKVTPVKTGTVTIEVSLANNAKVKKNIKVTVKMKEENEELSVNDSANQELTWKDAYQPYLLGTDEVSKFDLKDLDGDGIPELLAAADNGNFYLFRSNDGALDCIRAYKMEKEKSERTIYKTIDIQYGYGAADNEIIRIDHGTVVFPEGSRELPECRVYKYHQGEFDTKLFYTLYLIKEQAGITTENCSYAVNENGQNTHFSLDEGPAHVQKIEQQFQEIPFVKITEQNVKDKFAQFTFTTLCSRPGTGL